MGFLAENNYFTTSARDDPGCARSLDVNLGWRTGGTVVIREKTLWTAKPCGEAHPRNSACIDPRSAPANGANLGHQPRQAPALDRLLGLVELHDGEACDGVTAFAAATTLREVEVANAGCNFEAL
jgi:hypothetical protein